MKNKIFFISIMLIFVLFPSSIILGEDVDIENLPDELAALVIALQQNIEVKIFELNDSSVAFWNDPSTTVILVPINKEIIDNSVNYRAYLEGISVNDLDILLEKAYREYLYGDYAVFSLFVINNKFRQSAASGFESFDENIFLHTEEKKFNLIKYTRSFDGLLGPGWNKGYLYFPNFKNKKIGSYTVHFNGYDTSYSKPFNSWSFTFDETDIGFLSLLQKGLSASEIQRSYGISLTASSSLDISVIMDIASLLLTFISIL